MENFLEKHKNYLENAMNDYYNNDLFIKYYNKVPKSRYYTFNYCYNYYKDYFKDIDPVIVELGTTRSFIDGKYYNNIRTKIGRDLTDDDIDIPELMEWDKNNPEKWDWSAGCFTKIFSNIFPNSIINSIDIMQRHLNRCKIMNSDRNNINYHFSSSENFLNNFIEKIDLLYLDTGNMDEETAQLHLREVKIIIEKNILSDKGLILIDDVRNPYMMINGEKNNLGKSKYSINYLIENGYKIIVDEYQVILSKCPFIEHL